MLLKPLVFIVQHAQDAHPNWRLGKMLAQTKRQKGVWRAMKLHPGQTAVSDSRHNLVETCIHENAIFRHLAGQLFRDPANEFSLDLPWTWSKNESHCVRTTFCRKTRIFKVGVAADLDPHGGLSLAHWAALPGRSHKEAL